jgi:uncharacterized membrane protein
LAYQLAGRIAMSVMLLFTAMGHIVYTKGMTMMLPDTVPHKLEIVHVTGILEVLFAIGLFFPTTFKMTGVLLILFFILVLPANVHAALEHIDIQQANTKGPGPQYLWFRVPLQLFFIAWTYLATLSTLWAK